MHSKSTKYTIASKFTSAGAAAMYEMFMSVVTIDLLGPMRLKLARVPERSTSEAITPPCIV
jgi:hypothetical protein